MRVAEKLGWKGLSLLLPKETLNMDFVVYGCVSVQDL
jgi:hypothetical protein